jgi:chromosome condensin MukBEF ATPase and DNA-binding subunit MukB
MGADADVIKGFLQLGILGPVLAVLARYTWKLHRDLREVEAKRTHDAQAVTQKLLELNDKWNQVIHSQLMSVEAQRDLLKEIKENLWEVRDALLEASSRKGQ